MLNDGIQARVDAAIAERGGPWRVVSGEEFLANPEWHEEVFGPAAVGVACRDFDELVAVARSLTGQLTASVHFADGDPVEELLPELVKIAGRLVANGFPTGVEVCPSMQHGGPYPASTDSRTTSVGTAAISRFARPVAWQGFPEALLPAALRDGNPQGITRLEG
jgi:NADP-dependent aldehyde dehydrogenase